MSHVFSHRAPTERTSFQGCRARNMLLLRSTAHASKYVDMFDGTGVDLTNVDPPFDESTLAFEVNYECRS
jgi:hypothetical protein